MKSDAKLIIVSGIPASGKSTLGRKIADELSIPFLDKDDILESLFNSLGTGDHEWRRRLSRASDVVLLSVLSQLNEAVAVSFWRHPLSQSEDSGTPIDQFADSAAVIVEVYCDCDHDLAAARFESRRRHPGHLDDASGDDQQMQSGGIQSYDDLGPLGLGSLITVNTNGTNEAETFEMFDAIKQLLTGPS